jgi:nucleotide-binding universal stress UspA family protein
MKIVCGTNFSEETGSAINVAAALAGRGDSSVMLVHAVEPGPIEFLEKHHLEVLRKRLQQKLNSEAVEPIKRGAAIFTKLVLGSPHLALIDSARELNADMIIVASEVRNSPLRWFAGISERTAQTSCVPTLVVRDGKSLLDWTRDEKTLSVFVCYDFSESLDAALRWAAALRKFGPYRISVCYVSWPPNETMKFGSGGDTSLPGNTSEVQALLERNLKERCREVLGEDPLEISVTASWTREDYKLVQLATDVCADLIVVGINRRTGLDRFWLAPLRAPCFGARP